MSLHDVLLGALMAEYGGTEEDWTSMRSLARVQRAVLRSLPEDRVELQARRRQVARVKSVLDEADQMTAEQVADHEARHPGNRAQALVTTAEVRAALKG